MAARQLTERAIELITNTIKANIGTALAHGRTYWADGAVTTEVPLTTSYFWYPKAHGYKCPAVFVIDDDVDFRQSQMKANFIDALMRINVAVKVEDKDQTKLVYKAWRYEQAMHEVLDLTNVDSSDNTVSIKIRVKRIRHTQMYTLENSQSDSTATFFKEVVLMLEVEFYENF